jgi:glutamate racemase
LIDPAEEVIRHLAAYLLKRSGKWDPVDKSERYFVTDSGSQFQEIAERWLGHAIEVERAELS